MNEENPLNNPISAAEQAGIAAAEAGAAEESAQLAEAAAEAAARDAHSVAQRMEAAAAAAAEEKASIELFELCTAILLAVGAICAGLCGYQNGLWNGNSVAQFTAASIQTTKAAAASAMANALIGHDLHVNIEAKRVVWQALLSKKDSPERDVLFHQAGYLLLHELGPEAFKDLGLPDEATRSAKILGSDDLPEEDLATMTQSELSPKYYAAMYRESMAENAKIEDFLRKASSTSQVSDQFSLVGVFYTISLALAGIGLVFKTRVRWAFFTVGLIIFVSSTVYMSRLQWA